MSMTLQLQALVERLGWTLLHSVWQWLVVGIAGWLLLSLLQRRSPQVRYLAAVMLMAAGTLGTAATFVLVAPQSSEPTPSSAEVATSSSTTNVSVHPVESATAPTQGSFTANKVEVVADEINVGPSIVANSSAVEPTTSSLQDHLVQWLPVLVVVWLAGVVLFSLRLGVTWICLQRLAHRFATPVTGTLRTTADRLCASFGIRQSVRLLESARVAVPMALGWLRPVVLLPTSIATGLAPDQLEALLAHELAHIARRDYFVNLIQCVVETLFYYHPVVWWLSRTIRREREEACDDLAVSVLESRIVYARALTELAARQLGSPKVAVAASGGGLVRRIERLIVSSHDNARSSASPPAALVCLVLLVGAAVAVVGLPELLPESRAEVAAATDEASSESPAPSPSGTLISAGHQLTRDADSLPAFGGTVVDVDGKPAEGNVFLRLTTSAVGGDDGEPPFSVPVAETKCEGGRFLFPATKAPHPHMYQFAPRHFDVIVQCSGKALAWQHIRDSSPIEFKLRPEFVLRGRITSGDKGVAGATVSIVRLMTKGELAWKNADPNHYVKNWHPQSLELRGQIKTTTNSQGEFELAGLPREAGVILEVEHPDFIRQRVYAATTRLDKADLFKDLEERVHPRYADPNSSSWWKGRARNVIVPDEIEVNPVAAELRPGIDLEVRVVDEETGKPVPNAVLPIVPWQFGPGVTKSADERGVVRYENFTAGKFDVSVEPPPGSEFLDARLTIELKDNNRHETFSIPLRKGAIVKGTVVDRKTKTGVGGATIYFLRKNRFEGDAPLGTPIGPLVYGISCYTTVAADGIFQLAVPPVPGRLILRGNVRGYRTYPQNVSLMIPPPEFQREVDPKLNDPLNVTFELDPAPALLGRVLDPEGQPVSGAQMRATVTTRNADRTSSHQTIDSVSDADGRFTMHNLFTQAVSLTNSPPVDTSISGESRPVAVEIVLTCEHFEHRLGAQFELKAPTDVADVTREFRLEKTGRVVAHFVDGATNKPVANARVVVYRREFDPLQRMSRPVDYNLFTDTFGKFEFDQVIPGIEHYVQISRDTTTNRIARSDHKITKGFRLDAGETYDAGTVELQPDENELKKIAPKLSKVEAPDVSNLDESTAYDKLATQYEDDMSSFQKAILFAPNEQARKQLAELREPTASYARAFFRLGENAKDPSVACRSLGWVANSQQIVGAESEHIDSLRRKAVELLLDKHLSRPELIEVIDAIMRLGVPERNATDADVEKLAERIIKANDDHVVQGKAHCGLYLHYLYQDRRSQAPYQTGQKVDGHLRRQIELATLLRDRFGDIKGPYRGAMKDFAERELFELTRLQVGQVAPETVGNDLQDKPMSLTEFRGKIVVIGFTWSSENDPLCSELEELQQYFEKKHKGRVVVVAVCEDASREAALAHLKSTSTTFRSWYDGPDGPIERQWNIRSWPTMHVIDAEGKIRYKNFHGLSEVGPALEVLLALQKP